MDACFKGYIKVTPCLPFDKISNKGKPTFNNPFLSQQVFHDISIIRIYLLLSSRMVVDNFCSQYILQGIDKLPIRPSGMSLNVTCG